MVEEFNRSSKSVISTTTVRSEELLKLLIELGMPEHSHTHMHAPTHTQTPVQVMTPVFVCLLFTVRHGAVQLADRRTQQHGRCVLCFTPCRLSFTSQRASQHTVSLWLQLFHTHTLLMHTCSSDWCLALLRPDSDARVKLHMLKIQTRDDWRKKVPANSFEWEKQWLVKWSCLSCHICVSLAFFVFVFLFYTAGE